MFKIAWFIMVCTPLTYCQSFVTEKIEEKKWVLHSNINIPAAKFHLLEKQSSDESKGHLELFASYGVGLSLNYGTAILQRDLHSLQINRNETEFSNIFGFQCGLLFSSKIENISEPNFNNFSAYAGLNILDLQVGMGYELGAKLQNTSGYFCSISYGIPLHKLNKNAALVFTKEPNNPAEKSNKP